MGKSRIPTEAERLDKYFAQLRAIFPYVTEREVAAALARPCKYRKILEERKKQNPDGSGG